jgi:hypothetical protein
MGLSHLTQPLLFLGGGTLGGLFEKSLPKTPQKLLKKGL